MPNNLTENDFGKKQIENLKNKPQNKMDVGLSLKMEWQEYDLRNQ